MPDLALTSSSAPANTLFDMTAVNGQKFPIKLSNAAVGVAFGSFATASAASSSRLQSIDAETLASLPTGAIAWVDSVKDWYGWQPTASITPDGIVVVKPDVTVGAGRFMRLNIPWTGWTQTPTFTAWSIDPINGNDENNGDAAHPLQTDAERQRRWGQGTLLAAGNWSINWTSTNLVGETGTTTDPFCPDVQLLTGSTFTFTSTKAIVATSTIGAFAAADRAAQTMTQVTDAGVNWTTNLKNWCRVTSGARLNASFCVAADLGGNVARVSTPTNPATGVAQTLQAGDPYEIQSTPTIVVGYIRVIGVDNGGNFATVTYQDVTFDMQNGGTCNCRNAVQLSVRATLKGFHWECDAQNFFITIALDGSCSWDGGGQTFMTQGVAFTTCFVGSDCRADFDGDFLFQGARLSMSTGSQSVIGFAAWFDNGTSNSLELRTGCSVTTTNQGSGGDLIWGTNNAGFGVVVRSRGELCYTTKPTINTPMGAGRQSAIGAVSTDWASVPSINATNQAAIVLFQ